MTHNFASRFIAAVLTGLIALGPAHVFAQDATSGEELLTPTDAQQDYNNQGVILIQDGEYKQAIASFRSSLSLGELNITYLNLGRAYFRLDRCLEARDAYAAVKTAPKVKAPTPDEIKEILTRFEAEYAEACSGTIAIKCEDNPMVSVGDQPSMACADVSSWPVVPGTYEVTATYGTGDVTEEIRVDAGSTAAVSFEKPEAVVEDKTEKTTDPVTAQPVDTSTPVYVWAVLGTGAAILATALVWDIFITGDLIAELEDTNTSTDPDDIDGNVQLRDEIKTNQTITLALAGAGAAVTLVGGILWLLSGDDEPETTSVSGWVDETSGGIVIGGSF